MSRLLITGGNGFLGKHITKEAKARGVSYVAPFSGECDLLNFDLTYKYLNEYKPTDILHAAGASPLTCGRPG